MGYITWVKCMKCYDDDNNNNSKVKYFLKKVYLKLI